MVDKNENENTNGNEAGTEGGKRRRLFGGRRARSLGAEPVAPQAAGVEAQGGGSERRSPGAPVPETPVPEKSGPETPVSGASASGKPAAGTGSPVGSASSARRPASTRTAADTAAADTAAVDTAAADTPAADRAGAKGSAASASRSATTRAATSTAGGTATTKAAAAQKTAKTAAQKTAAQKTAAQKTAAGKSPDGPGTAESTAAAGSAESTGTAEGTGQKTTGQKTTGKTPAEKKSGQTKGVSTKDTQKKDAQKKEAQAKDGQKKEAAPAEKPAGKKGRTGSSSKVAQAASEAPEGDAATPLRPTTSLLFQAPDLPPLPARTSRDDDAPNVRRRSRRRADDEDHGETPPNTVVKVRQPRQQPEPSNEPQKVKGSTRLEAKKQRRRDGRDAGRRRPVITEAEFLARRESVDRVMVVRSKSGRTQIGVLEDGVLVEHYVARAQDASLIGNVYLGKVQNVLPSMEAAFVDIGRGRNAVLYSGEVDWDAAETGNQPRRIELALKPGDTVLVQVTKDPVGHKGARLTSQVSLPGRYLVYVPNGSMNGISRKLPDTERARLKKILKEVLPENVGVIVRTAAEGATEEQLTLDVNRLTAQWASISEAAEKAHAPALLHSEPDLLVKIIRDVFNEDFQKLVIQGEDARTTIEGYLRQVAPDLLDRVEAYAGEGDSFEEHRIAEQIEKALERKVWLPSGGSLVIDRTEAMTVVDVNTGKFVGSGGNLEETVTKNNLEAAEEIVRQLRLRDIGGIIVVDFIDMVLESNRDLVLRRLVECLSRDRTKHQVAEVTSLGLVQMTRKKLGLGLLESFSEPCEVCGGRGIVVQHDPVVRHRQSGQSDARRRGKGGNGPAAGKTPAVAHAITEDVKNALAQIAASTIANAAAVPVRTESAGTESAGTGSASTDSAVTDPAGTDSVGTDPAGTGPVGDPSDDVPAHGRPVRDTASPAASAVETPPAPVAEAQPRAGATAPEPGGPAAPEAGSEGSGTASAAEPETLEILDIPVKKVPRQSRRISSKDAEQLLDSVLDALPEPKPFGQGRSRTSRRASSPGGGTGSASAAGS